MWSKNRLHNNNNKRIIIFIGWKAPSKMSESKNVESYRQGRYMHHKSKSTVIFITNEEQVFTLSAPSPVNQTRLRNTPDQHGTPCFRRVARTPCKGALAPNESHQTRHLPNKSLWNVSRNLVARFSHIICFRQNQVKLFLRACPLQRVGATLSLVNRKYTFSHSWMHKRDIIEKYAT